ncbi:MAG: hypothetical protein WA294_14930 [Acidobacteriaceae bacterium]
MSRLSKLFAAGLTLGLGSFLLSAPVAYGQLNSNSATVALTANLAESLTISATPGTATFTLVPLGTSNSQTVAITQTWALQSSRAHVTLTGWFATAGQALTNGATTPSYIPSSAVLGQVTTGSPTTYTAFTQTTTSPALGVSGASLVLTSTPITSSNYSFSRTDNLNLEINLTGVNTVPAGTYTGTLNLQAQAL